VGSTGVQDTLANLEADHRMTVTEKPRSKFRVVGTRPVRHDGLDKVTGRAVYGADIKQPGLVYGAVLRSPHAHASIKRVDTSRAEKLPGVLAVMTGQDMPLAPSKVIELGEGAENLRYNSDKVMAQDKALFRGHPVAAVAAVDHNTALEALRLIDVEYSVLKPVLDVHQGMAAGAPVLLKDLVGNHLGTKVRNTNVSVHARHEFGDVDAGFRTAHVVVEREFELAMVHQGYIEPQNATATWSQDDRVTVWTSTQGAFGTRQALSGVLRIPESRIKVVPLEIGGGFGGKISIYLEPVAAILSKKCGRPVKLVMDRKSVFEATGPTPGGWIRVKLGADRKGRIVAAEADIRFESGAYPGSPIGRGMTCMMAPYRLENSRIDGYEVVVNKPKTSAYRAPGSTHAAFAMESAVDELAKRLGIDPIDLRLTNAAREGDRRPDGPRHPRIGCVEVLEAAKGSSHWNSKLQRKGSDGKLRGRGVANGYWVNAGRESTVAISVNSDGTVELVEGSTDIGGTRASIAMQAAEVLCLSPMDVRPQVADTESVGYTDVTGGSRTTYATGIAAIRAAEAVLAEMKSRAAKFWDRKPANVEFGDGSFFSKSDPELKIGFRELASKLSETGGPVAAVGTVNISDAGGAFGAHMVDVEVDPETGKVDVLRYTAVQDVGRAIHPSYVEGQIQGGAAQGIGWALNEEYYMTDEGVMVNSSFLDYRMPTALDLPMIETVLVEVPYPTHPFGVRGVGEVPIVAPVAAVANAIHDATGMRLTRTPMKPARVLEALAAQRAEAVRNGRKGG
jgi:CO/xanthine dehydrogenase Mo-binding subunit